MLGPLAGAAGVLAEQGLEAQVAAGSWQPQAGPRACWPATTLCQHALPAWGVPGSGLGGARVRTAQALEVEVVAGADGAPKAEWCS